MPVAPIRAKAVVASGASARTQHAGVIRPARRDRHPLRAADAALARPPVHRRSALDLLRSDDADVGTLLLDHFVLQEPDEGVEVGCALCGANDRGERLGGRELREEDGKWR